MRLSLKPAYRTEASPLWRRLTVLVALVMMLVTPVAQAGHIHGDWMPHGDHQVGQHTASAQFVDSEANCPLCVAMHTAMPAEAASVLLVSATLQAPYVEAQDRVRLRERHFSLFSRPPPSV